MRKSLKILSIVAALTMIPFQLFSVCADEQTVYTGTCGAEGDNITWAYDVSSQTLTFSGTGDLNTFTSNDEVPWLTGEVGEVYDARNVVVEEGITGLGNAVVYALQDKDKKQFNPNDCSVTVPESVITWDDVPIAPCVNVYLKYGSDFYFWAAAEYDIAPIYSLHKTGIVENEKYPTSGTTQEGLTWNFDYETETLTIGGTDACTGPNTYLTVNGTYSYSLFNDEVGVFFDVADSIIVDKDFVVPDGPENTNSVKGWKYIEDHFCYVALLSRLFSLKSLSSTVYYYKNSDFEKSYQAFYEYVKLENFSSDVDNMKCIDEETLVTTTESTAEVETTTTTTTKSTAQTGDVNLDSSVDLIDAVYLNKYVANVVDLTDTQLQDADCNGDGNVTDQDTAILMKYLVCSISELPYTE